MTRSLFEMTAVVARRYSGGPGAACVGHAHDLAARSRIPTCILHRARVREHTTYERPVYHSKPPPEKEWPPHSVKRVTFIYESSPKMTPIVCEVDEECHTLLDVMERSEISVEASCDGIAACSTCHCYLDQDDFQLFPIPGDHEEDMLELAADVDQKRSRLGCQVELHTARRKDISVRVIIPKNVNNLMDFIPFEDPK